MKSNSVNFPRNYWNYLDVQGGFIDLKFVWMEIVQIVMKHCKKMTRMQIEPNMNKTIEPLIKSEQNLDKSLN